MDQHSFIEPFHYLRDIWLPNLGVLIETVQSPIVESKSYSTSAEFKIKCNVCSTVLGGNRGYNCSNEFEVDENVNILTESGCSGNSEILNNELQHVLSRNSLLKLYKKGEFSLKEYAFFCLITCNNCNGRGTVTCGGCGGSGTQQQAYQAHVSDNVSYQGGREVSRYPVYETRYKTVSCSSCGGSGRQTCGTCRGDGVNTYKKTVNFYSSYENSMIHWAKFEKLTWVCEFIKNRSEEQLNIEEAVDWQYSEQILQENGSPGFYRVELPGTLTAAECKIEARSSYAEPTFGNCRLLGGIPYDTDFIFDEHVRWTSLKSAKIPLTGKALTPILENKLVEDCVRDMNNKNAPVGDISYLNMVRNETVQSLQELISRLYTLNKEQRDSVSIWRVFLNSFFVFCVLLLMFFAYGYQDVFSKNLNFGLYPMVANAVEVINFVIDRSFAQLDGRVDFEMWAYLSIVFIPAMALMKIFGSNKVISSSRMLKWYFFGALFVCAFSMQFFVIDKVYLNGTASNILIDLILLSLLGGILLARKGAFSRQKKYAKEYNSRRLMELLGYEEQN